MNIVYPFIFFLLTVSKTVFVNSAPVTFNTALPVAKGEYLARQQYIINQSGTDQSQLNRARTGKTVVTVLGYGISSKLALFGVLPFHNNSLDFTAMNGQRNTRKASGVGDTTLFARYIMLKEHQLGRNFQLAPFAGIKAPTGADDKRDASGLLPPSVQPGSGAWSSLAGIISTFQTLNYQIDTQLSYQLNNKTNAFQAGDIARLDGSFQYRAWPGTLTGKVPGFLYAVIETSLIHQQNNKINGINDGNSGASRLFLTPGIQYVTRRWIIESAIQIPLIQNLNGTGLENNYIARISGRFNF